MILDGISCSGVQVYPGGIKIVLMFYNSGLLCRDINDHNSFSWPPDPAYWHSESLLLNRLIVLCLGIKIVAHSRYSPLCWLMPLGEEPKLAHKQPHKI